MIFSTITQSGLTLTADTTEIPAQYSNNIQFEFVQDTENYSGYTPTVYVTLYDSSLIECADILNAGGNVAIENGIFTIGNQILYRSGYLVIGITLTNGDENISLQPVIYKVFPSVGGLSPLPPDTGEWQQVVTAYVDTYINPISQQLQEVVTEVANQQTQIDNAISVMGDYQIVSDNPVQIQFKKGNGDFGPTVDLGDGLASKSMVNGKYYQSAAEMYSGAASNYGIQVQQIMGAYVQDGTPTPDNPVEPEFNVINNFNTNGGNLFDASKLPTTSQGGATVTNNGDGSFTISGSGNLSDTFVVGYSYDSETALKLLNIGTLYLKETERNTTPYILIGIYDKVGNNKKQLTNLVNGINTSKIEITLDDIEKISSGEYTFRLYIRGQNTSAITPTTLKPILYQDGDGTWYPFNASNTPVSLELRALPDGTADVWEDGNITRNVAKVTFDGSDMSGWFLSGKGTYQAFGYDGINSKKVPCLCNVYEDTNVIIPSGDIIGITTNDINNRLYLCNGISNTIEELQTWLQSNPIDVYYALATPTTEPLEIPTLTSYYPFTNAWCDSQVPGMITWNVLTGNVKNDELDPAIQEYVDDNVPELISNYISQNVPDMITDAINSALASYCPFAIGDIYITSLSANPNTKYPGTTWQAISGETLVGYLEDDENFGTLGASVGEATHTLSVDEMPSHTHSTRIAWDSQTGVSAPITSLSYLLQDPDNAYGLTSQAAGGGQAHNNIQPSRVVMIWQRTA